MNCFELKTVKNCKKKKRNKKEMLLCADMGLIVRLRHSLFFVSAKAGPCYLFQIILAQVTSVIYCFPNSYGSDPTK